VSEARGEWHDVDPFDLPEWLGTDDVTWSPDVGLHSGLVRGTLVAATTDDALPCDLLAADVAYPAPLVPEPIRVRVHQAWRYGEALLVTHDDRLTVTAPGIEQSADRVLEMLGRLARAVGAHPERFAARLYLGRDHTACE
jgi:hypothetical protein